MCAQEIVLLAGLGDCSRLAVDAIVSSGRLGHSRCGRLGDGRDGGHRCRRRVACINEIEQGEEHCSDCIFLHRRMSLHDRDEAR